MKLTILGMNGPFPAPGGATSGYLVTTGSTRLVMDLGTGTLARLTSLTPPEGLDALILSHWHFDHCSDVLPLLYRLQVCADKPLNVYGPADEASSIRAILAADPAVRLHEIRPGDRLTIGDVQADVFDARHPVPAVMLRLTDGTRTLCYTGDTNTVAWLNDFARGADLLLADGLFTEAAWAEGKPHLSARLAAQVADEAGAGRLIITHLNPNIDPATLLSEARAVFHDVTLAACGDSCEV